MSENNQQVQMLSDMMAKFQEREKQRERNIDALQTKVIAHQRLPFPAVCKGRIIRKIDLEEAVSEFHALVDSFLASDHRYNFFTNEELEKMDHFRIAFDIVLNRSQPRQSLKGADRDYFLSIMDIDDHLTWVQTKDRGAGLSAAF